MSAGGLTVLVPLLKSADSETVTAAVAALRNLSIHKGNEVSSGQLFNFVLVHTGVFLCVCVCACVQVAIVESGALLDLKRLLTVQENPDIQCHAAGTLRNLGAENQTQVSQTSPSWESIALIRSTALIRSIALNRRTSSYLRVRLYWRLVAWRRSLRLFRRPRTRGILH